MKQNLNIMKTLHITDSIYFEMINRAERYENAYWDCIELENGCALTFAIRNGQPAAIEARDEEDNIIGHDFNPDTFNTLAA